MTSITSHDLGQLQLPPTLKSQSLLVFLLLNRKHRITRDELIGMYWPDKSESKARRSLSTALWHIKKCFLSDEMITSDRFSVQFSWPGEISIDSESFLLATKSNAQKNLEEALEFYRGEFLAGFFDDWVINERYRMQTALSETLGILMNLFDEEGKSDQALEYAYWLLRQDPLREDAHRTVMRSLANMGRRNSALEHYQKASETLRAELDTEPMQETTAVYQQIQESESAERINEVSTKPPLSSRQVAKRKSPLDVSAHASLWGRDGELASLTASLEQARGGNGKLVMVTGEAGVGKSRLLEEFVNTRADADVAILTGQCFQFERVLPFQPFVEIITSWQREHAERHLGTLPRWILNELFRFIPSLATNFQGEEIPDLDPTQNHTRFFNAVMQILDDLSNNAPMILLIEDLHWASESTLELLHYLIRSLKDRPILFIITYRQEDIPEQLPLTRFAEEILKQKLSSHTHLNPLSLKAAQDLITDLAGRSELADSLAKRLHNETKGNPFFIIEYLRSIFEKSIIEFDGSKWDSQDNALANMELPQPKTISEMILSRVATLPMEAMAALEAAATIGQEFDLELLLPVAQLTEEAGLEIADLLLRRRLIEETEDYASRDYRFEHHLVQDAIYHSLEKKHRQILHRTIAQSLVRLESPLAGEIAHHFTQANQPRDALPWWIEAGGFARQQQAAEEAIRHYSQAISFLEQEKSDAKLKFNLRVSRAEAYFVAGKMDPTKKELDELRVEAKADGNIAAELETLLSLGDFYLHTSAYPEAIQIASQAIALTKSNSNPDKRNGALRQQASGLYFVGKHQEALNVINEAIDNSGEVQESMALALINRALINQDGLFDFEAANQDLERANDLLVRSIDVSAKIQLLVAKGNLHMHLSDLYSAMQVFREGLDLARSIGHVQQEIYGLSQLALCNTFIGNFEVAHNVIEETLDISRRQGVILFESFALVSKGYIFHQEKDLDKAIFYTEQGQNLLTSIQYLIGTVWCHNQMAAIYRDYPKQTHFQKSRTSATQALELAKEFNFPRDHIWALSNLAMAQLQLGEVELALSNSEAALQLCKQYSAEIFSQEIYYNHFRVLQAMGNQNEATKYLDLAEQELDKKCTWIAERSIQNAYLSNIRVNREIKQARTTN